MYTLIQPRSRATTIQWAFWPHFKKVVRSEHAKVGPHEKEIPILICSVHFQLFVFYSMQKHVNASNFLQLQTVTTNTRERYLFYIFCSFFFLAIITLLLRVKHLSMITISRRFVVSYTWISQRKNSHTHTHSTHVIVLAFRAYFF